MVMINSGIPFRSFKGFEMKRCDLRPLFRNFPIWLLMLMVLATLPLYLIAGAVAGAWDRYNDWWDELAKAWSIQD
jgi:hypothetical protein